MHVASLSIRMYQPVLGPDCSFNVFRSRRLIQLASARNRERRSGAVQGERHGQFSFQRYSSVLRSSILDRSVDGRQQSFSDPPSRITSELLDRLFNFVISKLTPAYLVHISVLEG